MPPGIVFVFNSGTAVHQTDSLISALIIQFASLRCHLPSFVLANSNCPFPRHVLASKPQELNKMVQITVSGRGPGFKAVGSPNPDPSPRRVMIGRHSGP